MQRGATSLTGFPRLAQQGGDEMQPLATLLHWSKEMESRGLPQLRIIDWNYNNS